MPEPTPTRRPQPTVVVLGASRDPQKYGHLSVVAHQRAGYRVFPVNPHAPEIAGLPAFARLGDLPPMAVDRITVYLDPELTRELLPEIARLQPGELWLNPGADSPALVRAAQDLGLRVIEACSIVDANLRPVR